MIQVCVCVPGKSGRGEASEPDGDVAAEAEAAEDGDDAVVADVGIEVFEVEFEDNSLADVRLCVGEDGATDAEAVGLLVDRYVVEDVAEDPELDCLELRLGRFDEPESAGAFFDPVKVVVGAGCAFGSEVRFPATGQPGQFSERELEPVGQILRGLESRESVVIEPALIGVGGEVEPGPGARVAVRSGIGSVPSGEGLLEGCPDESWTVSQLIELRRAISPVHAELFRRVRQSSFGGIGRR